MENKQLHPRLKRRVMVRFGVEQPRKTAFTMNLSLSGAFIRTNQVLRPGTTIMVEFDFAGKTVTQWAQVVWAKKVPAQLAHIVNCGMGVRFVNPGSDWEVFFDKWKDGK